MCTQIPRFLILALILAIIPLVSGCSLLGGSAEDFYQGWQEAQLEAADNARAIESAQEEVQTLKREFEAVKSTYTQAKADLEAALQLEREAESEQERSKALELVTTARVELGAVSAAMTRAELAVTDALKRVPSSDLVKVALERADTLKTKFEKREDWDNGVGYVINTALGILGLGGLGTGVVATRRRRESDSALVAVTDTNELVLSQDELAKIKATNSQKMTTAQKKAVINAKARVR